MTRNQTVLLIALLAIALVACGGTRFTAAPVMGGGVRMELIKAKAKTGKMNVLLMAYNDNNVDVVVNRNQIAIITPNGLESYRKGKRELHIVPAYGKHPVNIGVKGHGNYSRSAGVYVRFDGVWLDGQPVDIPPMALGAPAHSPGQRRADLAPPDPERSGYPDSERSGSLASDARAPQDDRTARSRPAAIRRRRISAKGTKCATMPVRSTASLKEVTFIIDELLLTELQKVGFQAFGTDDINAILGFDNMKDTIGCDDASCMVEIGNALGVAFLIVGNVAHLGESTILTLKLLDVQSAKVISRVSERAAEANADILPDLITNAVQKLIRESRL